MAAAVCEWKKSSAKRRCADDNMESSKKSNHSKRHSKKRKTAIPMPETDSIGHIARHSFVIEKERFKCGIDNCNEQCLSADDYESHLKKKHSHQKRCKCPHCGDKIESSSDRKSIRPCDIVRHLQLHGNDLYWCGKCSKLCSSQFDIQLHIVRSHASSDFTYHYKNFDKKGLATAADDVKVVFECNICQQCVPLVSMTTDHFQISHPGAIIDCTAIELVTRTMPNMEVISIPAQKTFSLQKHLVCGLCDIRLSTKQKIIEHYRQKHPSRALELQISHLMCLNNVKLVSAFEFTKSNASFDRHLFFDCAHCHGTISHFSCIRDVYEHWTKVHDNEDDPLPFRFEAVPLVSCPNCNVMSTFQGLLEHFRHKHPNHMFVAVQPTNHKQCTLCSYAGDGILEHFRREHAMMLQENSANPVCLSDTTINGLLEINVRKKFRCKRCDAVHESEHDIRDHYLDEHNTLEVDRHEFYDNQSVELLCNRCQLGINQITFFEHLTNHERSFGCPKCLFRTTDAFEFMKHGIDAHKIHEDACTLDLKYLKQWFWHSQYVFGNGLILNKHNLVGTSIDDSKRFMDFIQAFVLENEQKFYEKQ